MTAVENDTGQITSFIFVERDVTERIKQSKILSINEFHLEELVDEHTAMLEKQAIRLQKALRRERDANELHRKFVTMTSHEFRTPLAIIDGEARRIFRRAEMIDQEEIATRMRKIRNAVDRMTRLMESILTVARLEAGKILIEPVACDPRETLTECCEIQREISPHFEIVLECADMEPMIVVDPATLEQVVTNLLSNAVKYSVNSPRIEVRGWTETPDVVIQVRDFGVGIDAEDLPKIFDRFFRAKTAGGIAGTGIGLNLIKTLIEQHEGTICATSVEGEGSTFALRLPIDGPSRNPGS